MRKLQSRSGFLYIKSSNIGGAWSTRGFQGVKSQQRLCVIPGSHSLVYMNWGTFDKMKAGLPFNSLEPRRFVAYCLMKHNITCKCNVLNALKEMLGSLRLLLTQTGFLGIGSGNLRAGDELWVVNGS